MQTPTQVEPVAYATPDVPLSLSISRRGRTPVSVIHVAGSLDAAQGPILERTLGELVRSGPGRVVVELAHVPFISSVGWKLMLSSVHDARARGGRVVLAGLSANAKHVHDLLELQAHLPAFESETEAVDSFHR